MQINLAFRAGRALMALGLATLLPQVAPAVEPWRVGLPPGMTLPAPAKPTAPATPPVSKAGGINIAPVPDLRADFMKGADVSMLDQLERAGAKFYDERGEQKDALLILKESGVNWIRLRLWNNPINDSDVIENGRTISRLGEPKGGGNNDLAVTLRLAKRAKALGLKFLLDFHYSDFWVDPEKQHKPASWRNLHGTDLEREVYRYTAQTLDAFAKAGAFPDMVQVGNELNGGLLWPNGKTWKERPDERIGGDEGFAALLREGVQAVRDADPKAGTDGRVLIAIHLANGGDNDLYRRVFDGLIKRKLDFDLIGLSFYPYWHGSIDDLRANMDDISSRYGKEVVVLETAYAFTTADGDGFPNLFSASSQKSGGYKATVQGQASFVRDVIEAVAQVPGQRGRGVFYWEPDWIPVRGVGWRTGEGNAWENQAMFDFNGRALPSLQVFRRVSEQGGAAPRIVSSEPLRLTAFVGDAWRAPESVKLPFSDDAERTVWVEWPEVKPEQLAQTGRFELIGTALQQDTPVKAIVEVVPRRNLFDDPSFEKGTLQGWTITGDTAAVSNERNTGNAHSGNRSLHYWMGRSFKFQAFRKFTGLKPGSYVFRAWSAGGGGENTLELFVQGCGDGTVQRTAITNTGWQQWKQYAIKGIQVTQGECTVGVNADAPVGKWGNVDDVEFQLED